jgi:hypothetical protein
MADEEVKNNGADLAVDAFGVKANVKNVKSLNTGATLFCAGMLICIAAFGYTHVQESKEDNKAFINAITEQTKAIREGVKAQQDGTAAQREQTCMLKFEQKDRPQNSEFCRQISGVNAPR